MLCVGVVPALVCFIILGTNGGLGAPCDTAVAPYLLVQALLTARPANRSDTEMRVLLTRTLKCACCSLPQGIASLTNVVFFCCCLPVGIALRMGGMRVIAITVQSLSLLFWFGWAIFGSMQASSIMARGRGEGGAGVPIERASHERTARTRRCGARTHTRASPTAGPRPPS